MDLVNRLKHYMDSSQVTISQFADRCGIPRPTMSQLMNGRNKRISDEVINKIHNAYPDLSILWLMFGEGDMGLNSNIQISEPQNEQNQANSNNQAAEQQIDTDFMSQLSAFTESASENSQTGISLFDTPNSDLFSTEGQQNSGNSATKSNISFEPEQQTQSSPNQAKQNPAIPNFGGGANVSINSGANNSGANNSPIGSGNNTAAINSAISSAINAGANRAAQPSVARDEPQAEYRSIAISPDAHKKITNIVVFYSDNSFQSFLPDAAPQVRS